MNCSQKKSNLSLLQSAQKSIPLLFAGPGRHLLRLKSRSLPRSGNKRVAILMVHGGKSSTRNRWLELSLSRLSRHTNHQDFMLYIWNNNPLDETVPGIVARFFQARLIHADPYEKFPHYHAVPLQKLYEQARDDGAETVVTLDTDAFPVHDHWLEKLIARIHSGCVLAGVWRNELAGIVVPYIHPSCLCTTVDFIENSGLRLDTYDIKGKQKVDTLAALTYTAQKQGKPIYALKRTNRNQLHYIMGGIYGDLVYHHGAGSRKRFSFWGEPETERQFAANNLMRMSLDQLVFRFNQDFVQWLRGLEPSKRRRAFLKELRLAKKKIADANHPVLE